MNRRPIRAIREGKMPSQRTLTRRPRKTSALSEVFAELLVKGRLHYAMALGKGMRGTVYLYFEGIKKPIWTIPIQATRVSTWCQLLWLRRNDLAHSLYTTSDLLRLFQDECHYKTTSVVMGRELRRAGFVCVPDDRHRVKYRDDGKQKAMSKFWWVATGKGASVPGHLRQGSLVKQEYDAERKLNRGKVVLRRLRELTQVEKKLEKDARLNGHQMRAVRAERDELRRPGVA